MLCMCFYTALFVFFFNQGKRRHGFNESNTVHQRMFYIHEETHTSHDI